VFDLWGHQWPKRKAQGEMLIVCYADDAILCLQSNWGANEYLAQLHQRLNKFGLAVHPEKTKLIRFDRFAKELCTRRKEGKPKTFGIWGLRIVAQRDKTVYSN